MIIVVSDFDLKGSGYMNIAIAVCNELANRGHRVMALGIGYKGGEHNWPFSIIPVKTTQAFIHIPAMIQNLKSLGQAKQLPPIQAMIVALDIPQQERLLTVPMSAHIPHLGIFPIESGPLCASWANVLSMMEAPCVISKFGLQQMADAGVDGIYLPIGLDTKAWRRPLKNERVKLREAMGYTEDQLIVRTGADNPERKNLSSGMNIIKETAESIDVRWMLVTRIQSQVGWKLDDMAIEKDVMERFAKYERGLPFDRLWTLYAIADVFLLPSKAEGLCMPILEAMATGVAVVATDCTAVTEHLFEDPINRSGQRGFPMDVEYIHQDVWGNSMRSYVDVKSGVHRLRAIYELKKSGRLEEMILAPARAYVETRTWNRCGDVLDEKLREIMLKEQPATMPEGGRAPATVPRMIPLPEEPDEQEEETQGEAQGEAQDFAATVPTAEATNRPEGNAD